MGGARLFPRGPAVADHPSTRLVSRRAWLRPIAGRADGRVHCGENGGHDFEQVGDAPVFPAVEVIHQKTIDFFQRYLVSAPWMRTER